MVLPNHRRQWHLGPLRVLNTVGHSHCGTSPIWHWWHCAIPITPLSCCTVPSWNPLWILIPHPILKMLFSPSNTMLILLILFPIDTDQFHPSLWLCWWYSHVPTTLTTSYLSFGCIDTSVFLTRATVTCKLLRLSVSKTDPTVFPIKPSTMCFLSGDTPLSNKPETWSHLLIFLTSNIKHYQILPTFLLNISHCVFSSPSSRPSLTIVTGF